MLVCARLLYPDVAGAVTGALPSSGRVSCASHPLPGLSGSGGPCSSLSQMMGPRSVPGAQSAAGVRGVGSSRSGACPSCGPGLLPGLPRTWCSHRHGRAAVPARARSCLPAFVGSLVGSVLTQRLLRGLPPGPGTGEPDGRRAAPASRGAQAQSCPWALRRWVGEHAGVAVARGGPAGLRGSES